MSIIQQGRYNLWAHLRVHLGRSGWIKMGGQFKLCHFLILECLTLQWSFNIGFASSEDCNLLGIIPWALRKELWVLQTSWRREGDKTRHYGQEIPRTQKLYEYANRNLATIATRFFFQWETQFLSLLPFHTIHAEARWIPPYLVSQQKSGSHLSGYFTSCELSLPPESRSASASSLYVSL